MRQYRRLIASILSKGNKRGDRTGTGTRSIFGYQMRFDLNEGFPLLTTKRTPFRTLAKELLFFIAAGTNNNDLNAQNVTIWDEWAREDGDLGPIYGYQWRSWPNRDGGFIDQLAEVIAEIKRNPESRRLVVSAWNVADIPKMVLPPCHVLFQFYVHDGKLSCQLYQRSADVFLGVPFNIASYALLTHMVAHVCGLGVGEFIWTGGDCHLYKNTWALAHQMLELEDHPLPRLVINEAITDIDAFTIDDLKLEGYVSNAHMPAAVAI